MNEPFAPRRPARAFEARERQRVLIATLGDDAMRAVPFGLAALRAD